MARISLALAAAAMTATAAFGIHSAQAQMPGYGTQAPPAYQTAPPPPVPMQAPMGGYGAPPPVPMGRAPIGGAPMGAPPMTAAPMGGPQTVYGRPVVPTPAQPFNNLQLPRQSVGDGAYGGGGLVLEYLPDGTRRVVQQ
jgi:hypothetical protein